MNKVTCGNCSSLEKKGTLKTLFSNLPDSKNIDQEISGLDFETLTKMSHLLTQPAENIAPLLPYENYKLSGSLKKQAIGQDLVKRQKVGCIIIAGGQGTRLGHNGPKGSLPVTAVSGKSLFQIFCEKVLAIEKLLNVTLNLAIMTSPQNDQETQDHFEENDYFGLQKEQIDFFSQTELPFLDFEGKLFRKDPDHIAVGPDGNGSVYEVFETSQIAKSWGAKGIEFLNFILVDNPLADPFDFELIGELYESQSEVCLKSCSRLDPQEKVGIILISDQKPVVVEYHEIPAGLKLKKEPCANLSMLAMTTTFAEKISKMKLPLHKVKKKATYYDSKIGQTLNPKEPNAWKFEKYLFDVLVWSKKTTTLVYPREEIFYPLKNKEGPFSIKEVQKALKQHEARLFEKLTQKKAPIKDFELSAQFYYPSDEFKKRVQEPNFSLTHLL